jgi:hypothetical protein
MNYDQLTIASDKTEKMSDVNNTTGLAPILLRAGPPRSAISKQEASTPDE